MVRKMDFERMLKILKAVRYREEFTIYDVERMTGYSWMASRAYIIYMQKHGLIELMKDEVTRKGRRKRLWRITEKGVELLKLFRNKLLPFGCIE